MQHRHDCLCSRLHGRATRAWTTHSPVGARPGTCGTVVIHFTQCDRHSSHAIAGMQARQSQIPILYATRQITPSLRVALPILASLDPASALRQEKNPSRLATPLICCAYSLTAVDSALRILITVLTHCCTKRSATMPLYKLRYRSRDSSFLLGARARAVRIHIHIAARASSRMRLRIGAHVVLTLSLIHI